MLNVILANWLQDARQRGRWRTLRGVARYSRNSFRRGKGLLTRPWAISRYMSKTKVRKLCLGSGAMVRPGWLNTDISPPRNGIVYLDATKRLPFQDDALDIIYAEHMFEHIPLADGWALLKEGFRVLKPGGRIRLATPNLDNLRRLLTDSNALDVRTYVDESNRRFADPVGGAPANSVTVFNRMFREWGHQFIYDPATLTGLLQNAGFQDVRGYLAGESDCADLVGVELHGGEVGEVLNRFETMALEAVKPGGAASQMNSDPNGTVQHPSGPRETQISRPSAQN